MTDQPEGHLVFMKPLDISVYQIGGRLQIVADIDADGIARLAKMLVKYQEILELLPEPSLERAEGDGDCRGFREDSGSRIRVNHWE